MGAARPADRPAGPGEDRLFVTTDAASRLGASKDWFYRNSSRLPFTVRLSERALRYSAKGIDRFERQARVTSGRRSAARLAIRRVLTAGLGCPRHLSRFQRP